MSYVDGYLLPIKKKNLKVYQTMAKKSGKIWKEYGAIDYKECSGDDLNIKGFTPFTKLVKAKTGETVIFAFVVFKSKKHRDRVNAKVMKDPRLHAICDPNNMPFDFKRMSFGGFKVIVDAR